MRTEHLAVATLATLAIAGCASTPAMRDAQSAPASRASAATCTPSAGTPPDDCTFPADVRAFLEDRALCDHFRGEPWPESDSDDDRRRRRELVDGVRTNCAGTDRQLAELRERYRADERVIARLAGFEDVIED